MAPMMISTSEVIRNSFSDHHSRSKAQMCLKKIIDIIISSSSDYYSSSSSSSKSKSKSKSKTTTRVRRGIDIDLNLRLGLPLEESEEVMMNKGFSACSGVGDEGINVSGLVIGSGDDDDDCNSSSSSVVVETPEVSRGNNKKGKQVVIDEQESSEITNLVVVQPIRSSEAVVVVVVAAAGEQSETNKSEKEDEKFQRKGYKNEDGYLGLLIEAAKLISGGDHFEENDEEKGKNGVELEEEKTGNESWMLDLYEDISPIVKSKRGRNQVLPYRFRDSVLDPWKRISRQRSSKNHQLHSCNKQDHLH